MSYTKQTWNTGDTITADKLNHMEDGIASVGGADLVITEVVTQSGTDISSTFSADGMSLDELCEKFSSGLNVAYFKHEAQTSYSYGVRIIQRDLYTISEDTTAKILFLSFSISDAEEVSFHFMSEGRFVYSYNGNETDGTYTYSNGHYTITLDSSSGGGT